MQTYKLVILAPAQKELEEIAAVHLNLVGENSARNITNQIYHSLEQLTRFPRAGAASRDRLLREAGYRIIISGKYICIYRLINDTVYVYHIAHGASNYPLLFKQLLNGEMKN